MPYVIEREDDQYCVYRADNEGESFGDTFGCHDTEEDAEAQMRALYAAEEDEGKVVSQAHEYKTFPSVVTDTDEEQGIVDAVFAVFGNVDAGRDIVHPGSFTKTFAERGLKIPVLDQHNTNSILNVIGKPLAMQELKRDELPQQLLEEYPDVTGGAYAQVQLLMDVPEGRGAFIRLRDEAVNEWSFGYDVLSSDCSKEMVDGEEITVRNLRTLKLYEISPVIFGMNPATTTVGVKAVDDDSIESPLEKRGEDLLEERKKALVKEFRGLLDELQKHSINAPAKDAGRDEDTTPDGGAEPQKALTPEQDEERTELLQKIREQLEE